MEYLVHRHGFLCATPQVTIGVGFQQSLGAGIFGGDGFLLQKVGGFGTAWLELSGELIVKNLAPGEMLRVHPGHVGAFQSSVSFQITTVPGNQEHDLRRRRPLSGGPRRAGHGVAADAAHFAARASDQRVPAAQREAGRWPRPQVARCWAESSDRFSAGINRNAPHSSGAPGRIHAGRCRTLAG